MTKRDKIRLLIADDFEVIRSTIARIVSLDGDIEIVAEASNGREAVEKACEFHPDVVLLDMRMPVMDGISALKEIMRCCPTSVLMVSAFANEGAESTLEGLELGAVDFVPKLDISGSMDIDAFRKSLLEKIRAVAHARPQWIDPTNPAATAPHLASAPSHDSDIDIVLIGASTGGPNALQAVISALPGDLPVAVLIAQHMPPSFTGHFAARLNKASELEVREAAEGDSVRAGQVLLAPGDRHLCFRQAGRVGLDKEPAQSLYRPSVDVLMHSGAEIYGQRALAVIMTGMGEDGASGIAALKESGGTIIAQDEATSAVYGMPRAVAHLADKICPLPEISGAILSYL